MNITNYWLAAFTLTGSCLKEIERLCAAFLWSGPDLSTSKAKISWKDICKKKSEGGLDLRPLKEVNLVSNLKLIWRINSSNQSLWVRWIKIYLVRKSSFWSIKTNSANGSWMWHKLLKLRDLAKQFHRKMVCNGENTSFWFDHWFSEGRLHDLLGNRGVIDMGIELNATMAEVLTRHRQRRQKHVILNNIEKGMNDSRGNMTMTDGDVDLWKAKEEKFKKVFSSKKTWELIRTSYALCPWSEMVRFRYNTPRYAFILWTVMHNRLATGDRFLSWNSGADASCVLCTGRLESRQHLFFECPFTATIWAMLVHGLLDQKYTTNLDEIVDLTSGSTLSSTSQFLLRYTLQTTIHTIWRERNSRRHGNSHSNELALARHIDKSVRNRLSTINEEGGRLYKDGLQIWFSTRTMIVAHQAAENSSTSESIL